MVRELEIEGLLTLTEAAKLLDVTRQTIHNRIKAGKLHVIRIDGVPFLMRSELLKERRLDLSR